MSTQKAILISEAMTQANILCKHDDIVSLSSLTPNPKNANKHPKEQIERLAKILKYQGIRAPIIVSKRSGFIVKGHGTLLAIKHNKWDKCPVVFQDFETEEQEYAFLQSDNAIASWADLDLSMVNIELPNLGPDFDIDLLGIKDFKIDVAEREDEDEIPEQVEAKTKLGDLYRLGDHRLLCGDSTDAAMVSTLVGQERMDMVFTDPPYGMNLNVDYDEMFKNDASKIMFTGKRFKKIEGDEKDYDPSPIFLIEAKDYFIWGADYFYDKLPSKGSWAAWDKRTNESLDKVVGNTTEFCWSKNPHRRMTARVLWSGHHGMKKDDTKKRVHPTQKPVALVEWFFSNYASNHNTIVDIYGGSGSTLIACEKTNRKCFMMEIDPHYCDVIVARWEKYTGKKAVKT